MEETGRVGDHVYGVEGEVAVQAILQLACMLAWLLANNEQVLYCRYRAAPYQPLYEARPLPARTPAAYNARRSPPCGKGPPSHEQHGQPSSAQNNRPESSQDEVWVHVCTLGPVSGC